MAAPAEQRPTGRVTLREVTPEDLPIFFAQQLDPQANHMAAFTVPDPPNRPGFEARWQHFLTDPQTVVRTIEYDGQVAGNVSRFIMFGEPSVSYWLGREFWGRGIATAALAALLRLLPERPLYARAAQDNAASLRVLHKCGFRIVGEEEAYANARGARIGEYILRLDGEQDISDAD
jgi:RimJ/RimL family protein N-acetyltransferase